VAGGHIPGDIAIALEQAIASLAISHCGPIFGDRRDLSALVAQYVTILDVHGADAVINAIRQCWASAFSQRVAAYRAAQSQNEVSSMAVLVQRLICADAAGVAFTANPVTGDRTETVVSAVRGLGERLVSGQASPDEWVVKGNEAVRKRAPEEAIDESHVLAIAKLARRVEAHFGSPQDIEWVMADAQLFLVQARPITTLPAQTIVRSSDRRRASGSARPAITASTIADVPRSAGGF
jgi:pyruvate,water dikinase